MKTKLHFKFKFCTSHWCKIYQYIGNTDLIYECFFGKFMINWTVWQFKWFGNCISVSRIQISVVRSNKESFKIPSDCWHCSYYFSLYLWRGILNYSLSECKIEFKTQDANLYRLLNRGIFHDFSWFFTLLKSFFFVYVMRNREHFLVWADDRI